MYRQNRQQQSSDRLATLPFLKLLVRPYSLLARVEDANGRLVAYGCVDLPAASTVPTSGKLTRPSAATQNGPESSL